MAGQYSRLQARIASLNPLAQFIPCSGHSLNLVGSYAAESCPGATDYFMFVQSLNNFFCFSTHRWGDMLNLLKSETDKPHFSLKSLLVTRWSAQHNACKVLLVSYQAIRDALTELSTDQHHVPSMHT